MLEWLFQSGVVHAAAISWPTPQPTSIGALITRLLPIVYGIVGIVLFALFLYGGFMWLISSGDPDKVRKSADTMINAVIGVVIIIFAYFATRAVAGVLGGPLI